MKHSQYAGGELHYIEDCILRDECEKVRSWRSLIVMQRSHKAFCSTGGQSDMVGCFRLQYTSVVNFKEIIMQSRATKTNIMAKVLTIRDPPIIITALLYRYALKTFRFVCAEDCWTETTTSKVCVKHRIVKNRTIAVKIMLSVGHGLDQERPV